MSVKYFPLLLLLTTLAACTTPVKVHKIRGQESLQISCSGLGSSWEKCEKKARHLCRPNGYQVLTKSNDLKNEEPEDGFMGWTPGMYSRTLVIRCDTAAQ